MKQLLSISLIIAGLGLGAPASAVLIENDASQNSSTRGISAHTGVTHAMGDYFSVSTDPDHIWYADHPPRSSNAPGTLGLLLLGVAGLFAVRTRQRLFERTRKQRT